MTDTQKSDSDEFKDASAPVAEPSTSPPALAPAASSVADEKPEDGKFVLADEKHLTATIRQIMKSESFSGPTPHPKHVQQYEATLPGAAKLIFDEFKANSEHQRRMEERSIALQERAIELQGRDNAADAAKDARSQHYAAGLIVIGLAAALLLVKLDQPWVAGLVVGTLLVAVIGGFLKAKSERTEKNGPDKDDTEATQTE